MKVGTTRQMVSGAYGKRCGETNISILESLVIFIDDITHYGVRTPLIYFLSNTSILIQSPKLRIIFWLDCVTGHW